MATGRRTSSIWVEEEVNRKGGAAQPLCLQEAFRARPPVGASRIETDLYPAKGKGQRLSADAMVKGFPCAG